jgi:hypothetical protein
MYEEYSIVSCDNDLMSRVGNSARNSLKAKQVCATMAPTTIVTNKTLVVGRQALKSSNIFWAASKKKSTKFFSFKSISRKPPPPNNNNKNF